MSKVIKLDEFLLSDFEASALYKEKMKLYNNNKIEKRVLHLGVMVLLYNLRNHLFPVKLTSRWCGPFTMVIVFRHGAI